MTTASKIGDMISLVRRLEAGEEFTAADIANDYGVTIRTGQRYLEEVDRYTKVERALVPGAGRRGPVRVRKP